MAFFYPQILSDQNSFLPVQETHPVSISVTNLSIMSHVANKSQPCSGNTWEFGRRNVINSFLHFSMSTNCYLSVVDLEI